MTRVVVVCEGQTEETFVRDVLSPPFSERGLFLESQMIQTSPGHRGGALKYDRVSLHLRNTLRQRNAPIVTTMFDLYKLDAAFPGFADAARETTLGARVAALTAALHADVVAKSACRPERFIPHIQPHEFEALLFSDVEALTSIEGGWAAAKDRLRTVRNAAADPEHINGRPETKPEAHLARHLKNPGYHKVRHGPLAAREIGLDRIEQECPVFARWIARLREVPAS